MSAVKVVGVLVAGFLLVFMARTIFLLTPIWPHVLASPWWIYAIIISILVSGYLSFMYAKEDKELEGRWIEQEGEAFLGPIREKRQNKQIVNK